MILALARIVIYSFIVLATVIMIVNYDSSVIMIVNYDRKRFIVQATVLLKTVVIGIVAKKASEFFRNFLTPIRLKWNRLH
jgi:hypothetical protein